MGGVSRIIMVNMGAILEQEYYYEKDKNQKETFIDNILYDLELLLNGRQINQLNKTLNHVLENYDILSSDTTIEIENVTEFNEDLINRFENIKKIEGLSNNSIDGYIREIRSFTKFYEGPLVNVNTGDIKEYLIYKQEVDLVSLTTLDNCRRFLNTFFRTLLLENLIKKNPVKKIDRIKVPYRLKKPFTKEEIILMRMELSNLRDKSMFEMLLSSGVRVGELSNMKINDVNFNENSVYVIGKGNKERKTYFSEEARIALQMYLNSREDNNEYLFVGLHKPHRKLSKTSIGSTIRSIGLKAGVKKAHPHRFRRTMATNCLSKGMPIEQVQRILGHETVDTTTIYAITDDDLVNFSHKKYID